MGYCQIGGNTQSCTPDDCAEFGGNYVDDPSDYPGGCFLLSVLDDERAILMVGTLMYPSMIRFRDDIMRRTPLGRQFIAFFDEFYEEAKVVARKDPGLVTEIVWLATYIAPFIQAMLGEKPTASAVETPTSRMASEYRPATHRAFSSVVARLKKGGSKKFGKALDEAERLVARFVGMTPEDALREMRRAPGKTKAGASSARASKRKR